MGLRSRFSLLVRFQHEHHCQCNLSAKVVAWCLWPATGPQFWITHSCWPRIDVKTTRHLHDGFKTPSLHFNNSWCAKVPRVVLCQTAMNKLSRVSVYLCVFYVCLLAGSPDTANQSETQDVFQNHPIATSLAQAPNFMTSSWEFVHMLSHQCFAGQLWVYLKYLEEFWTQGNLCCFQV